MPPEPPLGAHLKSARTGYSHHGIYVGEGRVIHYAGWADDRQTGPVEETDLATFTQGNGFEEMHHTEPAPADVIVSRARSRLNESAYDLASNNCEHFCNWCVDLDHSSAQIDRVTAVGAASIATVAGLTGSAAVATSGTVAGFSGPGIMSGLAWIGAGVGGGAVAGIATIGATPGLATATLMNYTVLADPKISDSGERKVRKLGRAASYAGAVSGTVGSVAAVSAMGTAGLSGAGISSGLAALGGIVGGGMAAGVMIATTAPVLTAVLAGYTTYKVGQYVSRRSRLHKVEKKHELPSPD